MSDPVTARPEHARRGQGDRLRRLIPGPAVWATMQAVARPLIITVGLVSAYYLLPFNERGAGATSVLLVGGLVGVALVFAWEIWAIMRSPYPRLRAIEALAVTLVLFLMIFAGAYYALDNTSPGSFSERLTRTDSLYFTLTTLSTVGYGDITARSQTARVMAMLQMACGLLLAGFALRVLTGAIATGLQRKRSTAPGPADATDDGGADRNDGADQGDATDTSSGADRGSATDGEGGAGGGGMSGRDGASGGSRGPDGSDGADGARHGHGHRAESQEAGP
ncbi:potassium channel family protein [Streptomyces sp. NPDC007971]|uniref:potassium channel family protein n=1 Tax=Streptomyces sp. NPDC007971 TaxID=3364799 RepID=UPI0036F08E92